MKKRNNLQEEWSTFYINMFSDLKPIIEPNSLSKKPPEKFPPVEWKPEDALRERYTTSFGKVKFTGMEQVGGMKPAKVS